MSDYYDESLFTVVEQHAERVATLERAVERTRGSLNVGEYGLLGVPNSELPGRDEIPPLMDIDDNGVVYQILVRQKAGKRPKLWIRRLGRAREEEG